MLSSPISSGLCIFDLVVPYLDNKTIMEKVVLLSTWYVKYRGVVLKRKYNDDIVLDWDGKRLTSVPKEIGQLTNLQELDLNHNNLTSLPKEIGQLTNLKYLNLNYNKLKSIPKEIGQLINLQSVYLQK